MILKKSVSVRKTGAQSELMLVQVKEEKWEGKSSQLVAHYVMSKEN